MSSSKEVFPDHLMIRDTQIIPDDGGGRIYTTVGFGYNKVKYVRGDIHEALLEEMRRLRAENATVQAAHEPKPVASKERSIELPSWEEATAHVKGGTANALEKFIHHQEPAVFCGEDEFRAQLLDVLKQERGFWESEACQCIKCSYAEPRARTVEQAYELGWRAASDWAKRGDLISDIDSPAYLEDRRSALGAPTPPPGAEFQEWIEQWAEAYPLDVFPKPDLHKARDVLAAAGISLDCISADAMRHVITKVRDRMRATSTKGDAP